MAFKNKKKLNRAAGDSSKITMNEVAPTVIDLPQYLADTKAVPLLWGEGWDIKGKDSFGKRRLMGILEDNGVDGLFKTCEQNLSMREEGNQLWIVQPDATGKVRINLADMDSLFVVGTQNGIIQKAKTHMDYTVGTFKFKVMQVFENGVMTTIITMLDPETGEYVNSTVEEFNRQSKDISFLSRWEYGDLNPLIMFTNRSSAGITDQGDAYSSRGLQEQLNTVLAISNNETITNTTTIITKHIPGEAKRAAGLAKQKYDNMLMQIDGEDKFSKIDADPKLSEYNETARFYMDTYTQAGPYSTEADFNGTQTQVGVVFQGKKDIETTRIKKTTRESQGNSLISTVMTIDALFNVDVYGGDQLEFEINSFNVLESSQMTPDERMEKMIALGIATERDVIAFYYDTKDEAQIDEIVARLKKEGTFNNPSVNNELDEEDKEIDDGGDE